MKYIQPLIKCGNPECPPEFFLQKRPNQVHCCTKCKNRANYLKNREEMARQYAEFASMKKANKNLEKLARYGPEDTIYGSYVLRAIDVPADAALRITKHPDTGNRIHFFGNFGIEFLVDEKFRIIKRKQNGR